MNICWNSGSFARPAECRLMLAQVLFACRNQCPLSVKILRASTKMLCEKNGKEAQVNRLMEPWKGQSAYQALSLLLGHLQHSLPIPRTDAEWAAHSDAIPRRCGLPGHNGQACHMKRRCVTTDRTTAGWKPYRKIAACAFQEMRRRLLCHRPGWYRTLPTTQSHGRQADASG